MTTEENYQKLADTINEVWIAAYGGEPVEDVFALTMRIKNIAQDRDCWIFNHRVLQKGYNELNSRITSSSAKSGS